MSYPRQRRLFLKFATLCVLVLCLALYTNKATHSRFAAAAPQIFTVQVESQPDSPLQFSSTKILSPDPFSPAIEFTVVNKGKKGIRAFTLTHELVTDRGNSKGATFTHLAVQKTVLRPGQSKDDTLQEPYSSAFVKSIILSIDFVEFENGETWGKDFYNSAERLAGQRAGGAAILKHLLQVRKDKGPSDLLEAVSSEEDAIPPQEGHSPEWQDGFKTGLGLVRVRLKKAQREGGLKRVEEELQQPFDAADGRPK